VEAETIHRQTLAIRKTVLSGKHLDTLTMMNNLANVLDSQGKYAEAIKLYKKTSISFAKVLGEEHLHTLTCCENYNYALALQRKAQSADIPELTILDIGGNAYGIKESKSLRVARKLRIKSSRPKT
jgi:hypothetical protein